MDRLSNAVPRLIRPKPGSGTTLLFTDGACESDQESEHYRRGSKAA